MGIKIRKKGYLTYVQIGFLKGTAFDEAEVRRLEKERLPGFFRICGRKDNTIIYESPRSATLKEQLKRSVRKKDFFIILEQIARMSKIADDASLHPEKLIFDINYIFYNESTKEMYFLYYPIASGYVEGSAEQAIEKVIYLAKPDTEEDTDYISRFARFFNGLPVYDPEEIEAYIFREAPESLELIKGNTSPCDQKEALSLENDRNPEDRTRHLSQSELSHYQGNSDRANAFEELPGDVEVKREGDSLFQELADQPKYFTENADDDTDKTVYLFQNDTEDKILTVRREATGDKASVHKNRLHIGRGSHADLIIKDNRKVGRSHADIFYENGNFYVEDQNSLNHTFVNDRVIPALEPVRLNDGDMLKLADEIFTVMISSI